MYKRDFDRLLSSGLPRKVLLYGENRYMKDYYVDLYKERLDAHETAMSLYYDEYDFQQARSYLSQNSLFGGSNLLIIKRDKKIATKELNDLTAVTERNPDSYLLYYFDGSAKEAKSLLSAFSEKRGGAAVRLFETGHSEGVRILGAKASQLGMDMDSYALSHLFGMLNGDLSLCMRELEKLSVLGEKISSKDIDRLVFSSAAPAMDNLFVDLFDKKPLVDTIERLLEFGEDENDIIRALQRFVQQIFLFNAYIRLHGKADSAAILGYKLPRNIEEQRASLAVRLKQSSLMKIYEHIIKAESEIGRAKGVAKETILYGALIELQAML